MALGLPSSPAAGVAVAAGLSADAQAKPHTQTDIHTHTHTHTDGEQSEECTAEGSLRDPAILLRKKCPPLTVIISRNNNGV